jgi:hypothetical protein
LQDNALLLGGLESSGFHFNVVVPDWQVGSYVLAVAIADEVENLSGFRARDGNSCVRDGGTGGIRNGPDDGGILAERLAGDSQDEQAKKQSAGETELIYSKASHTRS